MDIKNSVVRGAASTSTPIKSKPIKVATVPTWKFGLMKATIFTTGVIIVFTFIFALGWVVGGDKEITVIEVAQASELNEDLVAKDEKKATDELHEDYPRIPDGYEIYNSYIVESSAYTASEDETDADPCTPANPRINLCDGSMDDVCIVASDYEFGTKIIVNGVICESHDVMNARYRGAFTHIDILKDSKEEAFAWGRRNVEVTVLKSI